MTAVTVSKTIPDLSGQVKKIVKKLTSPTTGLTYDTALDATDGKGAEFKEIYAAVLFDATNGLTECTWDASTGIITLGTVTVSPPTGYLHIEGI